MLGQASLSSRVALFNGVTVRSVNGPSVTVIEGAPEARCAYLGANAVLSGFTLTKGAYGGAWSSGVLTNCVLTGNSGGGVSGGTLYNCVLTGNLGGGVSGGTLYNCVLSANSNTEEWLGGNGGGARASTLYNCILTGNSAWWGGGAYESILYNCTVTGNSASKGAGGVAGCTSYNCIVYHNTGPKNPNYDWTSSESCCAWPLAAGPGNIAADPQLASAAHLSAGSPCLGAGSARHTSGTDIDGEPWADPPAIGADQPVPGQATGPLAVRIEASHTSVGVGFAVALIGWIEGHAVSSTWDFGDGIVVSNQPWPRHSWAAPGLYTIRLTAYNDDAPSGVAAIIVLEVIEATSYVDAANATPLAPYTSWATAAKNIQQAIDAGTLPGRLVLVANGVYRSGSVTTNGLNRIALFNQVTVKSVNGPESAIIEGAGSPNDDRRTRCAYVGAHAVLSGFTLRKGDTSDGGGAWCEDFGVLTNCVLTGNQAEAGGGVYGGALYNCTLTNNCAGGGGGAVQSTLYNCTLAGNYAEQGGGASGSELHDCVLSGNSARQGGAAYDCTLYDCTLTGNSAVVEGGGVSWSRLFNCTLSLNSAQQYGGGSMHSTLYNCTLTANSAVEGDGGGAWGGTLHDCTLTGNSAAGCGGGALNATLHNCLVTSNMAGFHGGGSYGGTLYNCTITRNSALNNSPAACRKPSCTTASCTSTRRPSVAITMVPHSNSPVRRLCLPASVTSTPTRNSLR